MCGTSHLAHGALAVTVYPDAALGSFAEAELSFLYLF
jgi:hypothetical protein